MQFMILLSALLASLTGFVSGERQPVRAAAEVHASAAFVTAQPEAAEAVAQARNFVIAQTDAVAARQDGPMRHVAHVAPARTRLSLKQSWLF